ncbi:class I SAM-dependent methyltransferase [Alteromonas sp. a30]|uniref:class I SAM-dependent methyltransferase n=1 Tax=Alteromonas sp. a30 TaxID=2730917 RepID=UPI00227E921C|nr:methyltransferase domain-containing protein [Alteromonas sp. a30]MCY7296081.1 class I SAM-dependent methyltransferase [Alteromonas sp. a30]
MRILKTLKLSLILAAPLPIATVQAAPANVQVAVAASERPAEAVALDESRKPIEVLQFLGLEQGDRALDLFTGTTAPFSRVGYYAEIMGRAVGSKGAVVAWEPANLLDNAGKKNFAGLAARVPNVHLISSTAVDLTLDRASFDFVLMHLVYHDTYWENEKFQFPRMDPDAFLAKIFAATKPGGIVGVVDHVAVPGGDTRAVVRKLHRIDPAKIRADFERAGFTLEEESDLLRNPADDHSKLALDPAIRGRTDRIIYRFRKPG